MDYVQVLYCTNGINVTTYNLIVQWYVKSTLIPSQLNALPWAMITWVSWFLYSWELSCMYFRRIGVSTGVLALMFVLSTSTIIHMMSYQSVHSQRTPSEYHNPHSLFFSSTWRATIGNVQNKWFSESRRACNWHNIFITLYWMIINKRQSNDDINIVDTYRQSWGLHCCLQADNRKTNDSEIRILINNIDGFPGGSTFHCFFFWEV